MRYQTFCALFVLSVMAGCSNQPNSVPTANSSASTSAVTDNSDVAITQSEMAEVDAAPPALPPLTPPAKAMDYGDWLPPAGDNPRLLTSYDAIVQSAISGDANGLASLAMLSNQMASELGREGDEEAGRRYLLQSGKAARAALAVNADAVPDSIAAPIFYNEAIVLAETGDTHAAERVLSSAMEAGFSDFERIESEELFAELRAASGFADKLDGWKQMARERNARHAREELDKGETFPFALVGTDISGVEQNLEALKGKVVIVDVWGTWCPPCRAEIPHFIKLQENFGPQGFQMIGLNYERGKSEDENLNLVVNYIADNSINYPCIMGDEDTRNQIPGFRGYPTTLFIDKTGKVRMKAVGLHDYEFLEAVVTELINES